MWSLVVWFRFCNCLSMFLVVSDTKLVMLWISLLLPDLFKCCYLMAIPSYWALGDQISVNRCLAESILSLKGSLYSGTSFNYLNPSTKFSLYLEIELSLFFESFLSSLILVKEVSFLSFELCLRVKDSFCWETVWCLELSSSEEDSGPSFRKAPCYVDSVFVLSFPLTDWIDVSLLWVLQFGLKLAV